MKKAIQKTLWVIAVFVIVAIAWKIAGEGVSRQERFECLSWKNDSERMMFWDEKTQTGYYLLQWQKDMCDAQGVEIRAKVIAPEDMK